MTVTACTAERPSGCVYTTATSAAPDAAAPEAHTGASIPDLSSVAAEFVRVATLLLARSGEITVLTPALVDAHLRSRSVARARYAQRVRETHPHATGQLGRVASV